MVYAADRITEPAAGEADVYQDDVFARLKWFRNMGQKFDIIYLDPPFTVESIFIPEVILHSFIHAFNEATSSLPALLVMVT